MSPVWRPDAQREPAHYAVVDTTFSTVNMGAIAVRTLRELGIPDARIHRTTVPGFKDLAVACKILLDRGCGVAIACGMPGPEPIDKQCAHEASLSLGQAQLMAGKHILEVFVHMDEAGADAELMAVCDNRVAEHAVNAYWLAEQPDELLRRAGTGQRQGFADVGPAKPGGGDSAHLRPASKRVPTPSGGKARGKASPAARRNGRSA